MSPRRRGTLAELITAEHPQDTDQAAPDHTAPDQPPAALPVEPIAAAPVAASDRQVADGPAQIAPAQAPVEPRPATGEDPAKPPAVAAQPEVAVDRRVGRPPSSPGAVLQRKQATLRLEQFDAIAHMRRQLNANRTIADGPAYTDSTLIRVAVDVLIACRDQLAGDTEDEITRSLLTGLGLTRD